MTDVVFHTHTHSDGHHFQRPNAPCGSRCQRGRANHAHRARYADNTAPRTFERATREAIAEGAFALVSSDRSGLSEPELHERRVRLAAALGPMGLGLPTVPADGVYTYDDGTRSTEKSFYVYVAPKTDHDLLRAALRKLAKDYEKESFVFGSQLVNTASGKVVAEFDLGKTKFGDAALAERGWTRVRGLTFALVSA